MATKNFKIRTIAQLGKLGKRYNFVNSLLKKLVHIYAIITNGRYTRGSLCIITNTSNEILLVESSYQKGKGFVGGLPNSRNEQPTETVIREIFEEINLTLETNPKFIGQYVQKNTRHIDAVFSYSLNADELGSIKINDGELKKIDWYDIEEASQLLNHDGKEILKIYEQSIS